MSPSPIPSPREPGTPIVALYAGSFDPITVGHEDLIHRALSFADRLVVAVATNLNKQPLFTVDERIGSPEWCYAFNCTDGTAISAVYSIGTLTGPRGLHFSANLFPPGSQGVCNHEMKP